MDPSTGDFPAPLKCSPDKTLTFIIHGSLSAEHGLSVFLFEFVCTFALVWVYFATAIDERSGLRMFAPLAVGFAMLAGIIAEGPGTGASLSPARTLSAAIVFGDLSLSLAPVATLLRVIAARARSSAAAHRSLSCPAGCALAAMSVPASPHFRPPLVPPHPPTTACARTHTI
jgi:hypothetical protein